MVDGSKPCDLTGDDSQAGRAAVFFGEQVCLAVIQAIGKPRLYDYTDEEDFLLGIMRGYDRKKQCTRYLQRKQHCPTDLLIG